MRRFVHVIGLVTIALAATLTRAGGVVDSQAIRALASDALGEDGARAARATAALRAVGPLGLEVLIAAHKDVLQRGEADPRWARLRAAIDRVAAQRDAYASRLYWYTDLELAKAAARETGRPILSLRLLGRLDEEMSCANSRLFRSLLYANQEVSSVLRQRFVLHWQSVRPVPRVRVDFGDGRVLERTITGNSIHYVLDAEGRPLDAIPGLWSPRGFLAEVLRGEALSRQLAGLDKPNRASALLVAYDRSALETQTAWAAVAASRPEDALLLAPGEDDTPKARATGRPEALQAGAITATKMAMERPILSALATRLPLPEPATEGGWARIAETEAASVEFDPATVALIARKVASGHGGEEATVLEHAARLERTLEKLKRTVAEDELRNRFELQPRVRRWIARAGLADLDRLNQRVYAELFLTPNDDPWLGLAPDDAYAAIEKEGKRESR